MSRLDELERRVAILEQQLPGTLRPHELREARMKAGWSQTELARRVGCHRTLVVRWESGQRLCSGAHADRVAEVFEGARLVVPRVG